MTAIDGRALLYDDLLERLAELEEENERLRALAQRLAGRLAEQRGVTRERALSDVVGDLTGEEVPTTPPPSPDLPAAVLEGRVRQHRGPGQR